MKFTLVCHSRYRAGTTASGIMWATFPSDSFIVAVAKLDCLCRKVLAVESCMLDNIVAIPNCNERRYVSELVSKHHNLNILFLLVSKFKL